MSNMNNEQEHACYVIVLFTLLVIASSYLILLWHTPEAAVVLVLGVRVVELIAHVYNS